MTHDLLPPLPEPIAQYFEFYGSESFLVETGQFTVDQMRSYALQAVEQYRKDAERYLWLMSHAGFGVRRNQVVELSVAFAELQPGCICDLDAAIDAAIQQAKEKP